MKPKISIIIVHWNTPDLLHQQLKMLINDNNLQIIIVNNASEQSVDWIKKDFPQVELIQNKFNRGYAFACNQGVVKGIGDWYLFLNPDVDINPEKIQEMLNYADKNQLDVCSPKTSESYQKPLPTWFSLFTEFTPLNKFYPPIRRVYPFKTLFGGCLLIRSEVIQSVGGWDERFFLWFEDSDLTKRLYDQNYKIGWIDLKIGHSGGESFQKLDKQYKRDIFFHSMDIYAKKHFSDIGKFVITLIKNHYSKRKLLPQINNCINITVPNLKKDQLIQFFEKNKENIISEVEYIIVTSSVSNIDIWNWRKKYPQIRFIPIKKNNGFAETVNIGLRVATGKWIGTVNDDVVLSSNWIEKCLSSVTNENVGSINPLIYKENGELESAGIKILSKGKAFPYLMYDRIQDNIITIDATNAACVLYNKEALNEVGLFDEQFGSYLEDIDLSLRLKNNGYSNIVVKNAKVIHLGQKSSISLGVKKNWFDFRNWVYVIIKNWGIKKIILNSPSIFIERLRNLSGIIKSHFK